MNAQDRGKFQKHPDDFLSLLSCDCGCGMGRNLPGHPACYENESRRRESFPKGSLPYSEATINDLARYGFFWNYNGSRLGYVLCYYCRLMIEDFGVNDLAGLEHLNRNPTCSMFHRQNMFNNEAIQVPVKMHTRLYGPRNFNNEIRNLHMGPINQREIELDEIDLELALRLENPYREPAKLKLRTGYDRITGRAFDGLMRYIPYEDRLFVFQKRQWPTPMSHDDLARYGFYLRCDDDRAFCLFCSLIVDNWQQGDLAALIHSQWSPSCYFLRNYALTKLANVTL